MRIYRNGLCPGAVARPVAAPPLPSRAVDDLALFMRGRGKHTRRGKRTKQEKTHTRSGRRGFVERREREGCWREGHQNWSRHLLLLPAVSIGRCVRGPRCETNTIGGQGPRALRQGLSQVILLTAVQSLGLIYPRELWVAWRSTRTKSPSYIWPTAKGQPAQ